jgi:hypothetical protein
LLKQYRYDPQICISTDFRKWLGSHQNYLLLEGEGRAEMYPKDFLDDAWVSGVSHWRTPCHCLSRGAKRSLPLKLVWEKQKNNSQRIIWLVGEQQRGHHGANYKEGAETQDKGASTRDTIPG